MISLSQKEIILGGLLGDSSCSLKKIISFSQCEKQKDYLIWKSKFFNKENSIKTIDNTWNNKKYSRCYFYYYIKKEDEYFYSFIRRNLYSDNRKKISLKYLNELTPLSLAIWWMDDGNLSVSKENRYGKLATECFNYEEHLLMKKYFKDKWDINEMIDSYNNSKINSLLESNNKKHLVEEILLYSLGLYVEYDNGIGR